MRSSDRSFRYIGSEVHEALLRASLTTPQQSLAMEIVDIGHINVTALRRDLVDANVRNTVEITMRQPVRHHLSTAAATLPPAHWSSLATGRYGSSRARVASVTINARVNRCLPDFHGIAFPCTPWRCRRRNRPGV